MAAAGTAGAAWETVEEAEAHALPGYMFVSRLMSLDDADEFHSPITLCMTRRLPRWSCRDKGGFTVQIPSRTTR